MNDQKAIAKRISESYKPKTTSDLDRLKVLDKKVRRFPAVIAYMLGIIGTLVMGVGMCLSMNVLAVGFTYSMHIGVAVGVVGIALIVSAYFVYKAIFNKRKARYSEQIISLADSLIN